MPEISKKQQKRILKYQQKWLQKISNLPKIISCDNCNRLGISDPECLSLEYCRKMDIQFTCGSCKFPQYANTLKTPTRGNVGKIYGYRFVAKLNKFIPIKIEKTQNLIESKK